MIDYRRRLIPVLRALEQDPDLSIEALADRIEAIEKTIENDCPKSVAHPQAVWYAIWIIGPIQSMVIFRSITFHIINS